MSPKFKTYAGLFALLLIVASLYARHLIQHHNGYNQHQAWKYDRSWELRSEHTSWLSLAGLFWLEEGTSTIGFGSNNDFYIRDLEGPNRLGKFIRTVDTVYFEPEAGIDISLQDNKVKSRIQMVSDENGEDEATKLQFSNLTWWVIARDGQIGIRVWDSESVARKQFQELDVYDYDPGWRVEARFVPYDRVQEYTYPTVIGTFRSEQSPGLLVFQHRDKQYEMIPFERDEGSRLFLVFGDNTNGEFTYGGGRFLYVEKPDESGKTIIDFNKAYNPPCAFSDYSTCPQPLSKNRLPVDVFAGEKKIQGLTIYKGLSQDPVGR